jgi:hypothetical protein
VAQHAELRLGGKGRYDRNTVGRSPPSKDPADPPSAEELAAANELVRQAPRPEGRVDRSRGLLKALTKTVLEIASEEELAEHLGYDKHNPGGRNRGSFRNAKRAKTVMTAPGPSYGPRAADAGRRSLITASAVGPLHEWCLPVGCPRRLPKNPAGRVRSILLAISPPLRWTRPATA